MDYIQFFLNNFNYFIDKKEWDEIYFSHSSLSEINTLSETLDIFGIDNILAEVPKSLFEELPNVFLAHIIVNRTDEIVCVNKISNEIVMLLFKDGNSKKYLINEFLDLWYGIILCIEDNPSVNKIPKNKSATSIIVFAFFVTFTSLLSITTYYNSLNLFALFYLFISILGLTISILALRESLGFKSQKITRFCSSLEKGDCEKVILSKEAEITNGISLSDLSFIYFSFTTIATFFINHFNLYFYLFIITCCTIPVIAYSIYFQIKKIKAKCIICIGISLTIAIQFILLYLGEHRFYYDAISFSITAFIFGIIASIWLLIKPQFMKNNDLIKSEFDLINLKRKDNVFNTLMIDSKKINANELDQLSLITLNKSNESKVCIILIVSLNCQNCNMEYLDIKKFILYHSDKMELKMIFNLHKDEYNEPIHTVLNRIIDLNIKENLSDLINALDDWYINKLTESKWLQKWEYPITNHSKILNEYSDFLNSHTIYLTPTIIINNTVLPSPYRAKDLKYLINQIQ